MNIEQYIKYSPKEVSGVSKQWINTLLALLPENSRILDIGSGTGRDADYMEGKGFRVTRTDKERGFLEFQKTKDKEVLLQDVLHDEICAHGSYRAVFTNAVLLHFTKDELGIIFNKIKKCLPKGGFFAFSLKQGDNASVPSVIDGSQYFCYWDMVEIENLCEKYEFHIRFSLLDEPSQWIYIICKK